MFVFHFLSVFGNTYCRVSYPSYWLFLWILCYCCGVGGTTAYGVVNMILLDYPGHNPWMEIEYLGNKIL